MCGIAGFCNYPKEEWYALINRMLDVMKHRGPDGKGVWRDDNREITLGHRRLSVIDLSQNGLQPMISGNGRFVISFNGEIYNTEELKKRFGIHRALRGYSDTEVLAEAIARADFEEVLKAARGMFALAVFDRKTGILRLARDRMGEKPLYYGFIDQGFYFSSDLLSFEQIGAFKGQLNTSALQVFFRLSYIPAPLTIYRNVYKVKQGHILTIKPPYNCQEAVTDSAYWKPADAALRGTADIFRGTEEEAAKELEKRLQMVIKSQMMADVPVGCFLSAGIDSSLVTAIMQSLSEKPVQTFTIGVSDNTNEACRAERIAKHLGTSHTELYVSDKDCLEEIPNLSRIYSEPFGDPTAVPSILLSKMAKQKVTVSLSGDGGDELFYGYTIYNSVCAAWNRNSKVPWKIRNVLGRYLEQGYPITGKETFGYLLSSKDYMDMYERAASGRRLTDYLLKNCTGGGKNFLKTRDSEKSLGMGNNLMLLDQQLFLPDSHMVKMDRASMSQSLETRAPLLDREIVEFAWRVPLKYKYGRKDGNKKILRDIVYKYIPKELLDMPKQGFMIPLYAWIRQGELNEWAKEQLSPSKIKREVILNEKAVSTVWKEFINTGSYSAWRCVWNILMYEQWQDFKNRDRMIKQEDAAEPCCLVKEHNQIHVCQCL